MKKSLSVQLRFCRFNLNLLECKSEHVPCSCVTSEVLISTYWNVNLNFTAFASAAIHVLISTYWNVNWFNNNATDWVFRVLISTYWNVNIVTFTPSASGTVVLISTYWNVNVWPLSTSRAPVCFNLNLLECKSSNGFEDLSEFEGFNLNLLECKWAASQIKKGDTVVLISTYWNVNIIVTYTGDLDKAF